MFNHGPYILQLDNEDGYALVVVRGNVGLALVREVQEGEAFAEAVRQMFRDVSNDQLEFRKVLRKVFHEFYKQHPAYAPGAHEFYLRIIRQYSYDQIEAVPLEEAG